MFDTHVHLDYEPFFSDLESVAARMREAGVTGAVNPAVDPASSRRAGEISERFPWVLPALGVHPLYVEGCGAEPPIEELTALAKSGRYFAVGEVGLDFWHGRANEETQRCYFEAQVALAARFDLPLLIHARKSLYEVMAHLKRSGFGWGGVIHAFSGSWEMAVNALDLGFHLSACANITRPTKSGLLDVFRRVPRDRLLVETDAPDMPPYPRREGTHYPWELDVTVRALADALGVGAEEVGELTEQNAFALFGRRE